jgi:hypothetical protein
MGDITSMSTHTQILEPAIMFYDDWYKYPATIQHNTQNKTFLRISKVLKMMGIKNNHFMLCLFDPVLMHVDPHDYKSITPEIATRIFLECRRNVWYYLREVVRIPVSGGESIPYELTRGNLALTWLYYNDLDVGLVQPRQTGKTIGTQSIMAHQMYFQGYNFDIAMYTKDQSLLQDNVMRLKDIRDAHPPYLIEKDASGKDKDAKEGVTYTALKNRYLTFVNSNNERDAYKLGRGATVPTAHIDEIAYFNYIWITFPSIIASNTRAAEDAARLGKRCANIYTTTAGRTDTQSGMFTLKLFDSGMKFTEKLYDCKDKAHLHEVVTKQSKKGKKLVFATFSHRQLGKTDEWLRVVIIRTEANSADDIERDYLNIWKAGQEHSPIEPALLTKIQKSIIEPKYTEINQDGYIINWYLHEDQIPLLQNTPFVISMDSGEQVGRDDTALVFLNPLDMGVMATLRCNDLNIIALAKYLSDLLIKRFPKSVFIPECKSTGRAILDYILDEFETHGVNPWTRIYNKVVQNIHDPVFKDFNIYTELASGLNRKLMGFTTTSGSGIHSRNMLYKTTLLKTLHLNHSRIYDETLARQFTMLVIKNGRIDHSADGHDDLVFAYLLCCWFLFFGKNLHIYGINSDDILSEVAQDGTTEYDKNTLTTYKAVKDEIKTINRLLAECPPSNMVKHLYIRKLKELTALLETMDIKSEPITREQLITQTKENSETYQKGINLTKAMNIDKFII